MSNEGDTNYRHTGNVRVRLALFWVSNYFGTTFKAVIVRAEEMLNEHGIGLECWPGREPTDQSKLAFPDRLVEREDYESLRSTVNDILIGANLSTTHLPVLFCQFRHTANGLTIFDTAIKCWERPMCMVSPTVSGDNATLLHEVGHAGGLDHDNTSNKPTGRNFMNEAESRSTMFRWQIEKMAKAFYSTK